VRFIVWTALGSALAGCWTTYTVGTLPTPRADAAGMDVTSATEVDAADAPDAFDATVAPGDARADAAEEPAAPPCPPGMARCGVECVAPLDRNRAHCGECDNRCRWACRDGHCDEEITDLTLGYGHTCVVFRRREVYCWGANSEGQLGNGGTVPSVSTPARVQGIDDADRVIAGESHTCALHGTGAVSCWGANEWGQLGDGTTRSNFLPERVSGLEHVQLIGVGLGFSCAVTLDRGVRCWGRNDLGQLGRGDRDVRRVPELPVLAVRDVVGFGCAHSHACVRSGAPGTMHAVWCWGDDSHGALGRGRLGAPAQTPERVSGIDDVREVGTGASHTCALKTDGTVWCWGSNFRGQLGTPAGEPQTVPRQVADLANIQQLAVAPGQNFSCALDGAGIPWCWGSNESGQLGRGTMETVGRAASVAIGDWRLTLLRAGGLRACGVPRDNPRALVCWGWSDRGTFGPAVMTSMAVRSPMLITLDVPIDP